MAETKTILVAGATGQQGGAVARELMKARASSERPHAERNRKFKDLATAGIEGVQGDLTDRTSLAPLLRKRGRVLHRHDSLRTRLLRHPEKEVQQGTNAIDAAKVARVSHVVLASVASADEDTGSALRVEGEGGATPEGVSSPAHDHSARRLHGQLREPVDGVYAPGRDHAGPGSPE